VGFTMSIGHLYKMKNRMSAMKRASDFSIFKSVYINY
jgi:hypothetical protein